MVLETEKKLTNRNINPTAMRLLVLDFLLKQNSAIRLTDIEKGMEPADRTTIYRSLKTFEAKGLVHSIDDGTGFTKYALCPEACVAGEHNDLHVHFYCVRCKETFCIPDSKIPDISLSAKFRLFEVNLVVKGICDRCPD